MDFLRKFLIQTHTNNLAYAGEYPREYSDLTMKVGFGMGTPTKIPWIGIYAHFMSISNGYYPVYLYYKENDTLILAYGISETNIPDKNWPDEILNNKIQISDFINNPFRYGDSYVFKHYNVSIEQDKVKFLRDGVLIDDNMLKNELDELINYYKNSLDIVVKDEESSISSGLFYMEQQLEDFIIENWNETEFGQKYDLLEEDGELISQQYRTDIGRIDILAKDRENGNYVVIELKRNQTSDDTIGQITRYMGWVQEHLNDPNVKGIIVAGRFDERLYYAQMRLEDIEVFLYEVNFKLNNYDR